MGNAFDFTAIIAIFVLLFFFWRWILGRKQSNRNSVNFIALLFAFISGIILIWVLILLLFQRIGGC